MKENLPQRKNIRLKQYDYSQEGYYFVTICTNDRMKLFGEIVGADRCVCPQTKLTKIGREIEKSILKMNTTNTKINEYIIMPDHIHIVIQIVGGQSRPPLHKIIQKFKSITTNKCFKFGYNKIWQRNYYEHVIRNDKELFEIKNYIQTNPLSWIKM